MSRLNTAACLRYAQRLKRGPGCFAGGLIDTIEGGVVAAFKAAIKGAFKAAFKAGKKRGIKQM